VSLPQALLLDLDDTILDDSSTVSSCWLEACRAHCSDATRLDPESVFESIERIRRWFWSDPERHRVGRLDLGAARREVVRLALAEVGVENRALADEIGDTYHSLRVAGIQPIDEAIATVRWFRTSGCRLALLTNGSGPAQRDKVNRFDLGELFDVILIEGEVGFGKPDPRIYSRALEELGVASRDAWMVGDNLEWDVVQPQRQGIAGIWIDLRGAGVPHGRRVRPDRIIRRLADLREPARRAEKG
jgi:putative hydrolase of the HAD superfamily